MNTGVSSSEETAIENGGQLLMRELFTFCQKEHKMAKYIWQIMAAATTLNKNTKYKYKYKY